MSTGYGWEGIRQVCAFVRRCLVRAMYLSASAVAVTAKGRLKQVCDLYLLPLVHTTGVVIIVF